MTFIKVTDNKNVFADGVHDDTKALQECIDKVKDGGTVYFPDGTYLVSSSLIFYSNQVFKLSDNAVILRNAESEPITRYLLASYSEPEWKEYEGTHDVIISGGIFDGNSDTTEKSTLVNTVHCRNIRIEGCRFCHCSTWHMIEINSTENATVTNCIFDGPTYTKVHDELLNEEIQLDLSREGSYGPVYNCDGTLIDFCKDDTVCRNITIENNIFKCAGFPAIGHHGDCAHNNIIIRNNIFDGPSGLNGKSRGYIIFRPMVHGVEVNNNIFVSPQKSDSPNYAIRFENPDKEMLTVGNNIFTGKIDKEVIIGDFPNEMIKQCAKKAAVAVDVQAYLRHVNEENGKMYFEDWADKKEILPYVTYLKTDAAEAEILTGTSNREQAAKILHSLGAKEILITHNSEVLVYDGEKIYTCPIKARNLSGRTGRGDTTFAAYITERLTKDIPSALLYATATVSLKMETPGAFRGTMEDVEKYIEEFYG